MAKRDVPVENRLQENSPFHEERVNFKINLLKNPNYFGTFPGLGGVVKEIQYNTFYEQLACLGLNPGAGFDAEGTLEAVIEIKQANGYDSGPCGAGSTEWVRFYVENGSTWTDLGASGVTVYNLAGSSFPVSYAVSIDLDEVKKFCTVENVLNVRAILSWELEPPANTPDFIPVWGNVVDARVQIAPAFFFEIPLGSLIGSGLVTIDPLVKASVDLAEPLPAKPLQPLPFAELKKIYAGSNVPVHRFGFAEAVKTAAKPLGTTIALANVNKGLKVAPGLSGAELAAILAAIEDANGNTTYEQLTCAGYNPRTRTLEAVVEIKLNAGYSGGLCTAGSTEYVSFFGFFGGAWNSLGTAQVTVHDLAAVTAGNPVNYAVFRLSNLTSEICEKLEAVPLRAILSWQTVPTGPDFIPVWGNVLNTFVQPQIGQGQGGQNETATLLSVGDVGVTYIQSSSNTDPNLYHNFLANTQGEPQPCTNAYDSPFGGEIYMDGEFTYNPAGVFDPVLGTVLPGAHPVIYQVFITPPSGPKYQLTNSFGLTVQPASAVPEVAITQAAIAPYGPVNPSSPGGLFYTYYETVDGQVVEPRWVARFLAGGLPEGNYTVELDGYAWDGALYQPMPAQTKTFYVYNGYGPGNGAPETSLNLISAADCGNVAAGDIITGEYSVADQFFGSVTIAMTQVSIGDTPIAMPTVYLSNANSGPDQVIYDGSNTEGTSGTFTIDTTGLPACGYTIQLTAWDRALVDTSCEGHEALEAVGFCLVAATAN